MYKIHPDIIEWIASFLKHRKQQVRVNNAYSKWVKVLSGVPQGSGISFRTNIIYSIYQ